MRDRILLVAEDLKLLFGEGLRFANKYRGGQSRRRPPDCERSALH
jgi:hypothetical protein